MARPMRILLPVALLLVVMAFYSPYLDHTMQCDEANTLYKYASNPFSALLAYTTPNNHLFHSFLVWITTSLMGLSQVAVRLATFMGAMLTIAMGYRVGNKVSGMTAGIATMMLIALSTGMMGFAVDARGYTVSTFLTLALIDQVFLEDGRFSKKQNYLLVLISFLLLYTLASMFLMIIPALLWLIWNYSRVRQRIYKDKTVAIIMGGILAGIMYLPAVVSGAATEHLGGFGEPSLDVLIIRWLELIYSPLFIAGIVLLFCFAGLIYLTRRRHVYSRTVLLIFAVAIGIAVAQFLLTGRTLYARNYFYLMPTLAILGGVGIALLPKRLAIVTIIAGLVAIPFLIPFLSQQGTVDDMVSAIMEYQHDSDIIGNHVCHYIAAHYEIIQKQGKSISIWTPESDANTVTVPIPFGFHFSVERAIQLNGYSMEPFAECRVIEDPYESLEVYECRVK